MAFPAKFPGKCASCGERFPAGTSINWAGNKTAVHASCGRAAAPAGAPAAEAYDPEAATLRAFEAEWAEFSASYTQRVDADCNPFE